MNYIWGNDSCRYYYFPIQKNAHTWGKNIFEKYFNYVELDNISINNNFILFVREPIKRWFSGAVEYLYQICCEENLPENFKIDIVTLKIIFQAIEIEIHTQSQFKVLKEINFNNCYFFDLDSNNFSKNLQHFFKNKMSVDVPEFEFEKFHVLTDIPMKINIKNQLLHAYNTNTKFKQSIQDYFKNDIGAYSAIQKIHLYEIK